MKYICITILVALLLSCGGQHSRPKVTKDRKYVEKTHYARIQPDTVQAASSVSKEEVSSQTKETIKFVNESSSRSCNNDDDNMRGFDPASENDMDDNGMSRYMENYDDEGWD